MSHKGKNRDERSLRTVLRGICWVSNRGNDMMMEERLSFIICISHKKFIRLIKPRRMRWVGNMTCVEDTQNYVQVFMGKTYAEYTTFNTQAQTGE